MERKQKLALIWAVCLALFLTVSGGIQRRDAALAARISPAILRFHVLANSDSPEDQAVKLKVKDLLLKEISEGLKTSSPRETQVSEEETAKGTDAPTKDQVISYILKHKTALEETADRLLKESGFSYSSSIRLETTEFPEKTYGDMTFPAGSYEAVRVLLGEGAGKNFWCVLYPSLCYVDGTYAVMPDESRALLKTLIPEDDFLSLLTARRGSLLRPKQDSAEKERAGKPRLKIKFKFYEMVRLPFTAQS